MLIPMLAASIALGQSSHLNNDEQTNVKMLTGVWRAQMDNLPAVDLVLTDEGGSLSGAVLFYLHVRKTVSDSYTSTPGHPEPLFNLRLDGKTLHFQVSHRRAHPPGSLSDPPASFRLELTGPNRAAMVNESEPAGERSPGLVMVRSDY
jgi:hypothetical protein